MARRKDTKKKARKPERPRTIARPQREPSVEPARGSVIPNPGGKRVYDVRHNAEPHQVPIDVKRRTPEELGDLGELPGRSPHVG
ncbi:MAG: hypothetical protein V3T08_10200 [Gemmatimonadota bacterium]